MAKTSKAQLRAADKYLSGQRQIVIRIDREKEADLLEWLEGKESMQTYIKELIRKDMANERRG